MRTFRLKVGRFVCTPPRDRDRVKMVDLEQIMGWGSLGNIDKARAIVKARDKAETTRDGNGRATGDRPTTYTTLD